MSIMDLLAQLLNPQGAGNQLANAGRPMNAGMESANYLTQPGYQQPPQPQMAPQQAIAAPQSVSRPVGYPTAPNAQPAPAAPAGGFLGGLAHLFGVPQPTAPDNETVNWLVQHEKMDPGTAWILANDQKSMQAYLSNKINGGGDEYAKRAAILKQYGGDPKTPEGQQFIYTGQMTRSGTPPHDSFISNGGRLFNETKQKYVDDPQPPVPQEAVAEAAANPAPANATPEPGQQRNEGYLKTIPAADVPLVKGLVDYRIDPGKLGYGAAKTRLLGEAAAYSNNTYDMPTFSRIAGAVKEFNTGGVNAPAQIIVNGNTALGHLADAWKNRNFGGTNNASIFNGIANAGNALIQGSHGKQNPTLASYNVAIDRATEELTKYYRGVGGSEADIQRNLAGLAASNSPAAREAALKTTAEMVYSKVNALQARWHTAMEHSGKEIGDFPIVSKQGADAYNLITGPKPDDTAPGQTAPAAPPPAAPAAIPGDPNVPAPAPQGAPLVAPAVTQSPDGRPVLNTPGSGRSDGVGPIQSFKNMDEVKTAVMGKKLNIGDRFIVNGQKYLVQP